MIARRNELAAACCVFDHGENVVDLWGGSRSKTSGEPWEEDTTILLFSTTKGLAAMAIAPAILPAHGFQDQCLEVEVQFSLGYAKLDAEDTYHG